MKTQKAWVFAQLKKGRALTPAQAFDGCGTLRLAAIIYELREEGFPISTETKREGIKSWAVYRLPKAWR